MKLSLLPKIFLVGTLVTLLTPAVLADNHRGSSHSGRPGFGRGFGHYSQGGDRRGSSGRRYYGSRSYRSYGYYPYRGSYFGYGYPYYYRGGTTLAIGLGSGYSTEYVRDDDRPVYRGQQLSEGNSSSLEISVQKRLAKLGYYNGSLDGDIGPASRKAISRFQRDNDLAETGRIDRDLVEALDLS